MRRLQAQIILQISLTFTLLLNASLEVYVVNEFAGTGLQASDGDGGSALAGSFDYPTGITGDGEGNVYISELTSDSTARIRQLSGVTPASDGVNEDITIDTVVGDGATSDALSSISLELPLYLWCSNVTGAVFVADYSTDTVYNISVAGDGAVSSFQNISQPMGLWSDEQDVLYVVEAGRHQILRIVTLFIETALTGANDSSSASNSTNGNSTTTVFVPVVNYTAIAGTGESGYCGDGGPATSAQLDSPTGLWGDSAGNIYVIDGGNQRLRVLSRTGTSSELYSIETYAEIDGSMFGLWGTEVDVSYMFMTSYHHPAEVQRVSMDSTRKVHTIAGGGVLNVTEAEGRAATLANVSTPYGIWGDANGSLYFVEQQAHRVRSLFAVDPTSEPTSSPTRENFCKVLVPCDFPTSQPSGQPSGQPSNQPSSVPTTMPSLGNFTSIPSQAPSAAPSWSAIPSAAPSHSPSQFPTHSPSRAPSTPRPTVDDADSNDRSSSSSHSSSSTSLHSFNPPSFGIGFSNGFLVTLIAVLCVICCCCCISSKGKKKDARVGMYAAAGSDAEDEDKAISVDEGKDDLLITTGASGVALKDGDLLPQCNVGMDLVLCEKLSDLTAVQQSHNIRLPLLNTCADWQQRSPVEIVVGQLSKCAVQDPLATSHYDFMMPPCPVHDDGSCRTLTQLRVMTVRKLQRQLLSKIDIPLRWLPPRNFLYIGEAAVTIYNACLATSKHAVDGSFKYSHDAAAAFNVSNVYTIVAAAFELGCDYLDAFSTTPVTMKLHIRDPIIPEISWVVVPVAISDDGIGLIYSGMPLSASQHLSAHAKDESVSGTFRYIAEIITLDHSRRKGLRRLSRALSCYNRDEYFNLNEEDMISTQRNNNINNDNITASDTSSSRIVRISKGTKLDIGTYRIKAIFTPNDNVQYGVATAERLLSVMAVAPVIDWRVSEADLIVFPGEPLKRICTAVLRSSVASDEAVMQAGEILYTPAPENTCIEPGQHQITARFIPHDRGDANQLSAIECTHTFTVPAAEWKVPQSVIYGDLLDGSGLFNAQLVANGAVVSSASNSIQYYYKVSAEASAADAVSLWQPLDSMIPLRSVGEYALKVSFRHVNSSNAEAPALPAGGSSSDAEVEPEAAVVGVVSKCLELEKTLSVVKRTPTLVWEVSSAPINRAVSAHMVSLYAEELSSICTAELTDAAHILPVGTIRYSFIAYDEEIPVAEDSANLLASGSTTLERVTLLPPGEHVLTAAFTPHALSSSDFNPCSATLNVFILAKVAPTIKWDQEQAREIGMEVVKELAEKADPEENHAPDNTETVDGITGDTIDKEKLATGTEGAEVEVGSASYGTTMDELPLTATASSSLLASTNAATDSESQLELNEAQSSSASAVSCVEVPGWFTFPAEVLRSALLPVGRHEVRVEFHPYDILRFIPTSTVLTVDIKKAKPKIEWVLPSAISTNSSKETVKEEYFVAHLASQTAGSKQQKLDGTFSYSPSETEIAEMLAVRKPVVGGDDTIAATTTTITTPSRITITCKFFPAAEYADCYHSTSIHRVVRVEHAQHTHPSPPPVAIVKHTPDFRIVDEVTTVTYGDIVPVLHEQVTDFAGRYRYSAQFSGECPAVGNWDFEFWDAEHNCIPSALIPQIDSSVPWKEIQTDKTVLEPGRYVIRIQFDPEDAETVLPLEKCATLLVRKLTPIVVWDDPPGDLFLYIEQHLPLDMLRNAYALTIDGKMRMLGKFKHSFAAGAWFMEPGRELAVVTFVPEAPYSAHYGEGSAARVITIGDKMYPHIDWFSSSKIFHTHDEDLVQNELLDASCPDTSGSFTFSSKLLKSETSWGMAVSKAGANAPGATDETSGVAGQQEWSALTEQTILPVGVHAIRATFCADESVQWHISHKVAMLKVGPVTPIIRAPEKVELFYNTYFTGAEEHLRAHCAHPTREFNIPGTFECSVIMYGESTSSVEKKPPFYTTELGEHVLKVTFKPTDSLTYTESNATIILKIVRRQPEIIWRRLPEAQVKYGEKLPVEQYNAQCVEEIEGKITGKFFYYYVPKRKKKLVAPGYFTYVGAAPVETRVPLKNFVFERGDKTYRIHVMYTPDPQYMGTYEASTKSLIIRTLGAGDNLHPPSPSRADSYDEEDIEDDRSYTMIPAGGKGYHEGYRSSKSFYHTT